VISKKPAQTHQQVQTKGVQKRKANIAQTLQKQKEEESQVVGQQSITLLVSPTQPLPEFNTIEVRNKINKALGGPFLTGIKKSQKNNLVLELT